MSEVQRITVLWPVGPAGYGNYEVVLASVYDKAQATIAEQAKMIEHLRGGPTPLYTAVDMANAARDGFRDGKASVVVELPQPFDGGDFTMYDGLEIKEAIIAAGGSVKE
jgi:hypothetical protein